MNASGAALLAYHRGTALRPDAARLQVEPWNRPRPFKLYAGLDAIALPRIAAATDTGSGVQPGDVRAFDLHSLAALLHWSAGIVRRRRLPDGSVMQFRAASCTGALYHIEVYAVCATLAGLPAGVYHYAPQSERLQRLRDGDWRASLMAACADSVQLFAAPVALVLSSEFWRNGWRYGERSYRHAFWDAGTILANLLALAGEQDVAARLCIAFADAAVNRLIGVDGVSEAALAVIALGSGAPAAVATDPGEPVAPRVVPSSPRPRPLPAIGAAHAGSSLGGHAAVERWRAASAHHLGKPLAAPAVDAIRLPDAASPGESTAETITRRGSVRRFAEESIGEYALGAIVQAAASAPPGDAWPHSLPLSEPLLAVRAVDGAAPGLYRVLPGGEIARIAGDSVIGSIAALAPDGTRAERAAATLWWTVDLSALLDRLGGRGYRAVQLEAGVALGRVYLAATAHGLGVSGLTFFDDEAAHCFAPSLPNRSIVLAAAVGRRAASRTAG